MTCSSYPPPFYILYNRCVHQLIFTYVLMRALIRINIRSHAAAHISYAPPLLYVYYTASVPPGPNEDYKTQTRVFHTTRYYNKLLLILEIKILKL